MGTELNNALKILASPVELSDIDYNTIKSTLIKHFDVKKHKYVGSIKFRKIRQTKGESIANFTLRLKQGASNCKYGTFLDRMLIEQLLHGLESRDMCDKIIS